ncbi:hypothetical protein PENSPDRAFT_689751 [Peniophora sp. CONT]|nr:hypothetical protein PENSPDRAFT_689751 [Peniophora sp. CONT]
MLGGPTYAWTAPGSQGLYAYKFKCALTRIRGLKPRSLKRFTGIRLSTWATYPYLQTKGSSSTVANSAFYIPPQGLAFRLIGHVSKKALVSRSSPDPHVTHKSIDKHSTDQLFTLLDGSSRHRKGYYAIKSKATGNFIYSRHIGGKCQDWHCNGDPNYDDEWFKLDPGKGAFMGMLRLVNKDTVILNGTVEQSEPELRNESKDRPNRVEQYFIFDFGEMEFLNIKYDRDDSKGRVSKMIHILDTQTTAYG